MAQERSCISVGGGCGEDKYWASRFPGDIWMQLMLDHLPSGAVVKNLPTNTGDVGLISGWGRSPGEGNGNPLQCSCLENPTDRGDWWALLHGVSKEADTSEQLNNRSSKNHTVWLLRWKSQASNERAFKKTFYWSIVALQCYVSFYCTMKWANCEYTYTPSFLDFRPI